ncbi:MAG TPA: beta-N-acetylhexosaminidase [Kutzneria sp.]|nr:beta-N-acetylhexosaminidase [Kutzneria sp.]
MSTIPRRLVVAAAAITLLGTAGAAQAAPVKPKAVPYASVVPAPATVAQASSVFTLGSGARIAASGQAAQVGDYLAGVLRPATGFALPVDKAFIAHAFDPIQLLVAPDPSLGDEGYQLTVNTNSVVLTANKPAGLFEGVQTLRQLLPASIDAGTKQAGPWTIQGGRITDHPRFGFRGAMLDVSRHFFGVDTVKSYIDEIARYKVNTLHLHLSDDQGWRIQINSWPRLATYGGSTQVGGGAGGYYTQAQYKDIVAYAASRFITVIPEIDMPGHTNAALASYAELNCNGVAPPLYTGTDVGFSTLCVNKDITYKFLDDVIGELAALTPGPYIHIGGDESHSTSDADYQAFIPKVQAIVAKHGKIAIGWHDISKADLLPSTIGQYWDTTPTNAAVQAAAKKGTHFVLSPANLAYLDMKYTEQTPLGQDWAGLIEAKDAYSWDPGKYLTGVSAANVNGVEGPLWTETITKLADIQYMAFPRLAELAELGWSQAATHNWTTFKTRLAAQGPRWKVQGVNFYASPQVPWAK